MNLININKNKLERFIHLFLNEYNSNFDFFTLYNNCVNEFIVVDNNIVGVVGYTYGDTYNDIHLTTAYILPKHRNKGYFTNVLNCLKDKFYYIRLTVSDIDKSNIFIKNDFKQIKKYKNFVKFKWCKEEIFWR